jgi:Zn-dependent protease
MRQLYTGKHMLGNYSGSDIVIILVSIIVSLVIHEYMHGYVGYLLGDTTARDEGRLSFNPLRHVDPFMTVLLPLITLLKFGVPVLAAKPVPFNPDRVKYDDYGAALLAAAGPFSNLVLAVIGGILANHVFAGSNFWGGAFSMFTVLNVALFVFNLVPIPPLDGSRVLYAFAPEPVQELMRSMEPFGLIVVFALVLVMGLGGVLFNIEQYILQLLP